MTPKHKPPMLQIEDIAFMLVFIAIGAILGFVVGKHNRKLPRHKVLIDKGSYDYLQERDEKLTEIEQAEKNKSHRSPVMYFVKGYMWNN